MVTWQQVEYQGWPNCYRLANGEVALLVTTDVGPRILQFGFVGEGNELGEFAETLGKMGGDEWHSYGGHRLWHAPELLSRTYYPDNQPVAWEEHPGYIRLRPPLETTTGIQKEIDIALSPNKAKVRLTHRLYNRNAWPITFAPWALTVMATEGTVIIPLPPRGTHPEQLLPASTLTLWAYTDMSDPRWTWGERYVLLRQEPGMARPQKVGAFVPDGWVAYVRQGHLFLKTFDVTADPAAYPDWGCNVESFTDETMIEVETLGPLALVEPGAAVEHVEHWYLWRNVERPATENDVEQWVRPVIDQIRQTA